MPENRTPESLLRDMETGKLKATEDPRHKGLSETEAIIQDHEDLGGKKEVGEKIRGIDRGIRVALEQASNFSGIPEKSVHPDKEERLLSLLTGIDYLMNDPHRLGGPVRKVDAQDSIRIASFIKAVSRMGTINPDGSVIVHYPSAGNVSPSVPVRVDQKYIKG